LFTGIVEAVGRVEAMEPRGDLLRLVLEAPSLVEGTRIGDSVAVNGACLTVVLIEGTRLAFDAVQETLQRTGLGDLRPGARVNLERALRAGGRLDGHLVQGHVDATGRVARLERQGEDVRLFVDCGPGFAELLVEKGSVAIDGVSLTVVGVRQDGFDVALIPHTLRETTLGERRPGDRLNLEADVLGKYVKKYLERVLTRVPAGPQP
jgi:riboflavin synthase